MSNKKSKSEKKSVHYEDIAPVCGNCKFFLKAKLKKIEGRKIWLFEKCKVNSFRPKDAGLCDKWQDKINGDTLDV